MKTPAALCEALEAVSEVYTAMIEDIDDDTTTPEAMGWLRAHIDWFRKGQYVDVGKAYELLSDLRDSLDEME